MATFNWVVTQTEYDIQPVEMDGAIVTVHWSCDASEESEGTMYNRSSYGTCSFSPDPADPSYIAFADVTMQDCLGWCFDSGVDKDAVEAALQANIDLQKNPTQAAGVPW